MPVINGRYYMNPQYGAALEKPRVVDAQQGDQGPTWLDYFLGLVPTGEEQEQSEPNHYSNIAFPDSSANQNTGDIEAQNQNSDQARKNWERDTNEDKARTVASTAEKYRGSADWAFATRKGEFGPNTNKCNQFVGDVTKEAGASATVIGRDGKPRYPLAAEWADPKTKISNWRVLRGKESPQPGDVAAYKLFGGGTSYSGHSGIVTSVGTDGSVHATAAHADVVGGDDKFQPDSKEHVVVFRRYTGGH